MPAGEPKKLPGIFISYRRSDNPDAVGRIYDRLVSEFGKARVFKDVDSIPLGQDFRSHLNEIVGDCAAVLAIVGPRWVDTRNASGQRRLEDPDDFVRIELEAALARNVPVVPVLVGHAPMPASGELPTSLASMAFRQSIEVRPDPDFHNDATRLVAALRAMLDPNAPIAESAPAAHTRKAKSPWLWPAAFTAATLAAIALALPALKHLRETLPPEMRFEIPIPGTSDPSSAFALSPDGRMIVYAAGIGSATRLWLRPLGTTTAQPLAGTEGAAAAFWSPDSKSIGFVANGALKRLDLGGGLPLTLVATNVRFTGSWNAKGIILFSWGPGVSPGQPTSLARVSATGGAVTEVPLLDAKTGSHLGPVFMPDGRRFLFGYVGGKGTGTYLGSLDGKPPVKLTPDAGPMAHLPSGWLLLSKVADRMLVAQRLDLEKAALVGEPVTVAQGSGAVSAAASGLVAYRSTFLAAGERQLAWRDRAGGELGTIGEPDRTYNSPRVSPDGKQVVVARGEAGKQDIWLLDGVRSARVTLDGAGNGAPAWSPDGLRIAYSALSGAGSALFLKHVNGLGEAEQLLKNDQDIWPTSWSRDGRFLLYTNLDSTFGIDIGVLSLTGDRKASQVVATPSREIWGQLSPDGKWVAYQAGAPREAEIYVRPFLAPGTKPAASSRWQVSEQGGIHPTWSPDAEEIFFLNALGEMMAVPIVVKGSALEPGRAVKLFQARILNGGEDIEPGRQYDVAPDGRFLINQVLDAGTAPITLIQNWKPEANR